MGLPLQRAYNCSFRHKSTRAAAFSAGMVQNRHRISKQQAAALGMLTSETGLTAMHAVLAGSHGQRAAVVGAVNIGYWRALLAGVPQLPQMYKGLGMQHQAEGRPPQAASKPVHPMASVSMQQQAALGAAWSPETVKATVMQVISDVMGIAVTVHDQPLAHQGMDSLAGLELRRKLQARKSSSTTQEFIMHRVCLSCMF